MLKLVGKMPRYNDKNSFSPWCRDKAIVRAYLRVDGVFNFTMFAVGLLSLNLTTL